MDAEDYAALVYGDSWPEPREWTVRAAATALRERPCRLAELALEPLAQADFPKLVIAALTDFWARP